jgi:thiamine pyrophosphokinase
LPDLITGDLDSIRDDVRQYYESCGVRVVDLSHDQDSTDLMKCIEVIAHGGEVSSKSGPFQAIVALGAQGGRLDHTLGHLSVLHMYRELPLILLGDRNLTRLVQKGNAVIRPSRIEGPKCGLVPLTGEAIVTSKGLEWNLENTKMHMGGLVSTSNNIVIGDSEPEVFVETDIDLIWTIELQH